jgi:diguanylate cyclase (GGDEF)-like protein
MDGKIPVGLKGKILSRNTIHNLLVKAGYGSSDRHYKSVMKDLDYTQKRGIWDNRTGLYQYDILDHDLFADLREKQQKVYKGEDRRKRKIEGQEEKTSIIFLDLDGFKPVNKIIGYDAGHIILNQVARIMKRVFNRKGDTSYRYGGDEFGILLRNTDFDGAYGALERYRNKFERRKAAYIKMVDNECVDFKTEKYLKDHKIKLKDFKKVIEGLGFSEAIEVIATKDIEGMSKKELGEFTRNKITQVGEKMQDVKDEKKINGN